MHGNLIFFKFAINMDTTSNISAQNHLTGTILYSRTPTKKSHLDVFTIFSFSTKKADSLVERQVTLMLRVLNRNLMFLTLWNLAAHFKRNFCPKQNNGSYDLRQFSLHL